MSTVRDILAVKGNVTYSVGPESTLYEALELMADKNIGVVLVVDNDGKILGIFSERDFVRKIIIKGRSGEITKVKEIMTTQVQYVQPDTSITDCMNLMTERRIRHLPVLVDNKPVGLVSIGDVVKAVLKMQQERIAQQDFHIGQLEQVLYETP